MRRPERIPIILNYFKKNPVQLEAFVEQKVSDSLLKKLLSKNVQDYWTKNYDQRFGQILYNLGLVKDAAYYKEDTAWLINHNYIKPEELLFWGRGLDKNNQKLPKTEYILLKDLTLDHIKAIIKYFKLHDMNINEEYLKYFNSRIKKGV